MSYWLLPLFWMSLIFLGSSDARSYQHSAGIVEPLLHWLFPHMPQARVETIHHILRKCAHLAEYSILALLLWRGIRKPVRNDPRPWRWSEAAIAVGVVFLYAATDEFHQKFVPNRTPLVSDVFIDTSGAMIGILVLWIAGRVFNWWPNRKRCET